jgi:hypothetical protein
MINGHVVNILRFFSKHLLIFFLDATWVSLVEKIPNKKKSQALFNLKFFTPEHLF